MDTTHNGEVEFSCELEADELDLVQCIRAAKTFTTSDTDDRKAAVISAEVIRAIVMNLPLHAKGSSVTFQITIPAPGIVIKGATIAGNLNLTGARSPDGNASAPLIFWNCHFDSAVTLTRAHFRHLSFFGSHLDKLVAPNLLVDGPLNLSHMTGVHPKTPGKADSTGTQVDLQGARIAGGLIAEGSHFYGHDNLAFFARDIRVDGTVQFNRSHFHMCRIPNEDGHRTNRGLNLAGAHILSDLELSGTEFRLVDASPDESVIAIMAEHATVEGDFFFNRSQASSDLTKQLGQKSEPVIEFYLDGLVVKGLFQCNRSSLDANIRAAGISIASSFIMDGSKVTGYLLMPNAEIGGNLMLTNSSLFGDVNAYSTHVVGAVRIGGTWSYGNIPTLNFEALRADNLFVEKLIMKSIKLNSATVLNGFSVDSNRIISRIATVGDEKLRCQIVGEDQSIYFEGENLYINRKKNFVYDRRFYYDFSRNFYGDFGDQSGETASEHSGYVMGLLADSEENVLLVLLTHNPKTNDYDVKPVAESVLIEYFHAIIAGFSSEDASAYIKFLNDRASLLSSDDAASVAEAMTIIDNEDSDSVETIKAKLGLTWLFFPGFYKQLFDKALRRELWDKFPSWELVKKTIGPPECNWNLHGMDVKELNDASGLGYGHARLTLDEFKYEYIKDPSIDGKAPGRAPTDNTFKIPAAQIARNKARLDLLQGLADWQTKLRRLKLDIVIDVLLLAGLLLLILFEPLRRLVPEVYQTNVVLETPFSHLGVTICFIVAMIPLSLFLNVSLERSIYAMRKRWLVQQYESPETPTCAEFRPFPYEHLARYLRARGYDTDARKVLSDKLSAEHRLRTFVPLRPLMMLYRWGFDYGLSPQQAITTFVVFLTVGWLGFLMADRGYIVTIDKPNAEIAMPIYNFLKETHREPVLMVATSTVNTAVARTNSEEKKVKYAAAMPIVAYAPNIEIPCENNIQPSLYAIDVFIPAIDLHQESQCEISTKESAVAWRWAKALYSLMGWLVTSLMILTVSGILRRQVEG